MAKCDADKCDAYCCRYISIHLDTPRSKQDFDEIRWFVSHRDVVVYKDDDDDWIVEVMNRCRFLKNNRCTIYGTRPDVCREYDPENCTHNSGEVPTKIKFTEPGQVVKYVAKRWPKKKDKKKPRKKKTGRRSPTR